MVTVKNLVKTYGDTKVLDDVSLQIEEGQIYGIIGQSGAGKSTLLRCLNGLEGYQGGSVQVLGQEVGSLSKKEMIALRKQMGMIFQNFNLLKRKNVYENVALPMVFDGHKSKEPEVREKVMNMLELVGLTDKAGSRPAQLSGGQKQRVAIARALLLHPRILLCDEATSALDPMITREILDLLQKINKELGITIIVVTHQMDVVKQICERVAFLKDGHVVAEGKPEEIFIRPDENVKKFLGESFDSIPSEGVNIQLFFQGSNASRPVIAGMAKDLGVEASIVWGKLDDFRGTILGSLVIQIRQDEQEKVFDYLNRENVTWEVLH